jgi:phosphomannomutase
MSEAPLILGVSGLRGIVGESLTPEVAVRYAGAFGGWLREQIGANSCPRIALARDGRWGGESLYWSVCGALTAAGCQVVLLDVAMTPSVGVIVDWLDLDAGVIITASHNPYEWNGIKLLVSPRRIRGEEVSGADAAAPSAATADEIIAQYHNGNISWVRSTSIHTPADRSDGFAVTSHLALVREKIEAFAGMAVDDIQRKMKGRRVVVDSINSSGVGAIDAFFRISPLILVQLAGIKSGIFPHTPEPTKENLSGEGGLCDAVPGLKADVGFAQDPDADRLAIVDEKGSYIGEEYTLVLCAAALMEARKGDPETARAEARGSLKPVFVVNLSTSRMIDDVAAHYGAEVARTPVGEANVVERMKQLKAQGRDVVMGGEGNGGVIWPDVTYVRDSLSAMALTLALMARTGKKVSELVAMVDAMGPGKKGYCILKRKAPLASKADAVPVVEHLTKVYRGEAGAVVDTQDGVRIDWPARGVWAHVRASNTEPIMRVIVEAPTEALATETAKAVEARIAEV